jgi:CRISPR/Cas system CMR-associated protein Cmr5 small subunit
MIINNGLLATAAYAAVIDESGELKRAALKLALDAVADYLCQQGILSHDKGTVDGLLEDLPSRPDAEPLQRATSEALAYLSYLKRFAKPSSED